MPTVLRRACLIVLGLPTALVANRVQAVIDHLEARSRLPRWQAWLGAAHEAAMRLLAWLER